MDSDSSVVVPTEDVVHALMDYLVDPILPLKSSNNDSPSLSLQQSIAKQMQAVVLLYNYYHKKQFPQLEFLDFESFCKVAVNAKPRLLVHLKYMQRCNAEFDGLDENLSITEKAIMDACNISIGLDPLKDAPTMEGWPTSKVAVFLTDSMKDKCLLFFSRTTKGVWSLIEKNNGNCGSKLEGMLDGKKRNEKKRATKRPFGDELNADETCLQQLALSAVKEATGIDPEEIIILESHVVYSLSEEKRTARFFIMKCSKSFNEDVIQVPIEDAINSLRGPLVKKSCKDCIVTPMVEYFHLLPYAGIITDWFSREMLANGSELLLEDKGNIQEFSPRNGEPFTIAATGKSDGLYGTCQMADIPDLKTNNTITRNSNQKENGDYCTRKCHNMDEGKLSIEHHPSNASNTTSNIFLAETAAKRSSTEGVLGSSKSGSIYEEERVNPVREPCDNESINVIVAGGNDICSAGFSGQDILPKSDHRLVPFNSDSQNLDKMQAILASKGDEMLRAALRVLLKRRDELYHQQRNLEDEIARCEKNLQTILSGEEDDLVLKIESVIQACNAACSKDATGTPQESHFCFEEQHSPFTKRKRLSEAILHLRNPCQDLDDICSENNWILPRYRVFPSKGGFHANVTVQGIDFECSGGGDLRADARGARESAATHILSKLRSMASQAH